MSVDREFAMNRQIAGMGLSLAIMLSASVGATRAQNAAKGTELDAALGGAVDGSTGTA